MGIDDVDPDYDPIVLLKQGSSLAGANAFRSSKLLQFQVAAWQAGRQKELADSSFVLLRTEAICYFGRRSLLLAKSLGLKAQPQIV